MNNKTKNTGPENTGPENETPKAAAALRFVITSTRAGIYFKAVNDEAKATLPTGRTCLRSFELCELLKAGRKVEIHLGTSYWALIKTL